MSFSDKTVIEGLRASVITYAPFTPIRQTIWL
jgi:hypothetical protein